MSQLITFTPNGLYCPKADIYIDPWRPVPKAIITHAHSDHARYGTKIYLGTPLTLDIAEYRFNKSIQKQYLNFGETLDINGVKISLHPAGHIPGSAQVRLEHKGEVWAFTGDFKTTPDQVSTPWEPIQCNHYITECTFGLPVFNWKPEQETFQEIFDWIRSNDENKQNSIITTYALGKAQRLLHGLKALNRPIYLHGALHQMQLFFDNYDYNFAETKHWEEYKKEKVPAIILCTPGAIGTKWINRFKPFSLASASGWMAMRGPRRRRGVDKGFVLSDHADWKGLNDAIKASDAKNIYVTHGYTSIFQKYFDYILYCFIFNKWRCNWCI